MRLVAGETGRRRLRRDGSRVAWLVWSGGRHAASNCDLTAPAADGTLAAAVRDHAGEQTAPSS